MTSQSPRATAPPLQAAIGTGDEGEACYVHGVVPWPLDIDPALRRPLHPVQGFGSGQAPGIWELEFGIYFLPFRDIAAIVRRVALAEFGPAALEKNLQDAGWVMAAVLAHQRVLDHVLTSLREREAWSVERPSGLHAPAPTIHIPHSVCPTPVPMKFCTIYRSEEGVRQAMAEHYDELAAALTRLAGKREWGVKMYCDVTALARHIEDASQGVALHREPIMALKAQMAGRGQGAAYFLKKKLEAALAEEVESVCAEYARRSHGRLAALAVEDPARGAEAVVNPSQPRPNGDRDEAMVLNAAYLVADERLEDFQMELARLQAEFAERGFRYELTGPWAPYNFVEAADAPAAGG